MSDELKSDAGAGFAAPYGSAVTFIIQQRNGDEDWYDLSSRSCAELVLSRIAELRRYPASPITEYRGIIRVTSDHLLPNDKVSDPAK